MTTTDLNSIKAQLIDIVSIADAAEYSTGSLANQRLTAAWANVGAQVPQLIGEIENLRRVVAEVESLTKDTDGNDVDGDAEIPVGEIRRALAEAAGR
ncbi:hypothetical protein ACQP2Y_21770 [Actinoplanes sp. CA-051413]|uniref:hypothetical protein n=1 Tax=Actinoplanes sp. CA-051413 TaxID=3239899 RepID=UPI003D9722E3